MLVKCSNATFRKLLRGQSTLPEPGTAAAEEAAQVWAGASGLAPISPEPECRPGGFTMEPSG